MNLFDRCSKGHDLTLPDAYIILSGGLRSCRECVLGTKRKRPKASEKNTIGSFDG